MIRTIFGAGIGAAMSAAVLLPAMPAPAQTPGNSTGMSFFITSVGLGKGADFGGLEGADRHCRQLAQAVGAGNRDWKAYLSTQAADGRPAVNARDRIGAGPWQNTKGQVIARNVEDLHATNGLTKQTGLTETGETVKGRGDTPNTHDILTGSQPDGTAFGDAEDRTCGNWTRSGTEGAAMVGHHDRIGLGDDPPAKSWNSSHLTRGGCSQDALRSTGGAGLLYCFAAD
ncbi:hypothetical protein FHW79_003130 [Azospirillum sp. OGB3]|uniref:hypothetical protein n=1 Tax=Azospirillum sp. OGB3 TaxID=2587012 RepID=UPI0016065C91|nr:hypothetical protein [Azospirillum sp. OGB3]MBB3265510.1 hypothetical protein [Azospirillum sp. OGB3]